MMKLVRLATLYFQPAPVGWRSWTFEFNDAKVQTHNVSEVDQKLRLLVSAQVKLTERPRLTEDQRVLVPEGPRKWAEAAIEHAANLIAVVEQCKRLISSPMPCIALIPESKKERAWLEKTRGIFSQRSAVPGARFRVDDEAAQMSLADRWDGVALLAEALAHDHPTGRFHEFLRLFERAFGRSSSRLVEPLDQFLSGTDLGYTQEEVRKWVVDLRHPATHADKRMDFVLESDIRPVIRRIEQAAYDVLFNKAEWRNRSPARRATWSPPAGTTSPGADVFVVQGRDIVLKFQALDDFGSYPWDMSIGKVEPPKEWWTKVAEERTSPVPL